MALMSGVVTLGSKYGGDDYTVEGVAWAMAAWLGGITLLTLYLENRRKNRERWEGSLGDGEGRRWVGKVGAEWLGWETAGVQVAW